MITLRLDQQLELAVENTAARLGISKSELVRQSLIAYLENQTADQDAWELGEALVGSYGDDRLQKGSLKFGRYDRFLSRQLVDAIERVISGESVVIEQAKTGRKIGVLIPYDQYKPPQRKIGILGKAASFAYLEGYHMSEEELLGL